MGCSRQCDPSMDIDMPIQAADVMLAVLAGRMLAHNVSPSDQVVVIFIRQIGHTYKPARLLFVSFAVSCLVTQCMGEMKMQGVSLL